MVLRMSSLRVLRQADLPDVLALLAHDPVAHVFVDEGAGGLRGATPPGLGGSGGHPPGSRPVPAGDALSHRTGGGP